MSKYRFKITYRNENEYGQYWDDNRYTVSIIAETLEQAKQKLDDIEENDYGFCKNILEWEAEEITEDKDKEIERLREENLLLRASEPMSKLQEDYGYKAEVNRLNNIINEFNKLIENEINESKLEDDYERIDSLEYCLATLRELKGNGSNEKEI